MVNEDFIKQEDREALIDNSSKYATMERSELESEIYTNLTEHESNNTRKFLSKIKSYSDNEIVADFDYE